jgi:bacterioferritin-associated ferredoxin
MPGMLFALIGLKKVGILQNSLHLRIILIYNTDMIVCICHRVSDREITRHARAGMSFDDIQLELGVATQCGRCEGCARDIHSQCQTSAPQAHCHKAEVSSEASATDPARPIHFGEQIMEAFIAFAGGLVFTLGGAAWALWHKP